MSGTSNSISFGTGDTIKFRASVRSACWLSMSRLFQHSGEEDFYYVQTGQSTWRRGTETPVAARRGAHRRKTARRITAEDEADLARDRRCHHDGHRRRDPPPP